MGWFKKGGVWVFGWGGVKKGGALEKVGARGMDQEGRMHGMQEVVMRLVTKSSFP